MEALDWKSGFQIILRMLRCVDWKCYRVMEKSSGQLRQLDSNKKLDVRTSIIGISVKSYRKQRPKDQLQTKVLVKPSWRRCHMSQDLQKGYFNTEQKE